MCDTPTVSLETRNVFALHWKLDLRNYLEIQCFSSARWIHWEHSSFKTYLDWHLTHDVRVECLRSSRSLHYSQPAPEWKLLLIGWQTLAIQPWAPMPQGREVGSSVLLIKSVEKWDTREGGMLINKPMHSNTNAWNLIPQTTEKHSSYYAT